MAGLGFAVVLVANGTVQPGFDLAVVAAVTLAFGGLLALYAWLRDVRYRDGRISIWDVAGTCVFIGFASLILHQPVPGIDFPTP